MTAAIQAGGVGHATEAPGQWRAESLQMVNWGGFEGYHRVDLAAPATLLTGASGTGKSTLLDGYIALMMDSNTPFNGASNDNVIGRARSNEQRNVLSYMRGKVDTSREPGTGHLQDEVLRGDDTSTWSGVAVTWRGDAGALFTALRLYFAPTSAARFADITMHMATIDRDFDLAHVEEFAAERFPHRRMTAQFLGLAFHDTYTTFAATLHTRLGIGANGDGGRALKLLARIQGGRQVATVDGLYKTMVLEEPKTFATADRAVEHFDDLEASYQAMKTAEAQIRVLESIPAVHQALVDAEREVELIDTFRVHATETDTPLLLWALRAETALLETAIDTNRESRRVASDKATSARKAEVSLKAQIADVQGQQRANGGDALEAAERALDQLEEELSETQDRLTRYQARTEVLGEPPSSREQFETQVRASHEFLDGYEDRKAALEGEHVKTIEEGVPLRDKQDDLRREFNSLRGREGLIPHELHSARVAVAQSIGAQPSRLPFVAELLDMVPEHEGWREAAELALGGFALTMLVDDARLSDVRIRINEMRLGRRLRFEGARLNESLKETPGANTLPGRFRTKDTPFTGWLMNRLVGKFKYTCVDTPEELNDVDFGLTITGQTKQRRRGAHGGHGAKRVLGFSNAKRLQEIEKEVDQIKSALGALEKRRLELDNDRQQLQTLRDAHRDVVDTTWGSIAVQTVTSAIKEQQERRERILLASDVLRQLKNEEVQLAKKLEGVQRNRHLAENEQKELGQQHEQLVAREDEVKAALEQSEDSGVVHLTDEQSARLDVEFDKVSPQRSLDTFNKSMSLLRNALAEQTMRARRDADAAAKTLQTTFERFQEQWPRPNLGTGAESYDGYRDILDDLVAEGLHERRSKFSREVSEWSAVDLLRLHGAFEESIEEIESRLEPVNGILARLPFGPGRDRLHINLRRTEGKDIAQFRRELKMLASGSTAVTTDEEVDHRFKRLKRFIDRIRKSDKSSQREYLIDVRRHVYIEAERQDTRGRQLGIYTSLGGKSGGETQELIAFIVGAALRYQLGDATLSRPRYAPVFLDEGFIKSDSEFAGRAVSAWKGLGFQLIVSAPLDKVTGIEPYMDQMLQVTKNDKQHSHVSLIQPLSPAAVPVTQ
jgi:uncharacterized protein YPO0396